MTPRRNQKPAGGKLPRHPYPLLRVGNSGAFLSALESRLNASAYWRIALGHTDDRAVTADYTGTEFKGEQLSITAYDLGSDKKGPPNVISFATLAHRWFRSQEGTGGISDGDIASAFRLVLPVVRDACQKCGVRCRIVYPKAEKVRPLAPRVAEKLSSFVVSANINILHPLDWERFYRFVRYCYSHNVSMSQSRLRKELTARRVPAELADELALCYAHGRGILKGRYEWVE